MKQFSVAKDILIRKECFGGLVINRRTFMHKEITHAEYEFLNNLEKCAGYVKPAVLLTQNTTGKNVKYKKFLREGIIEECILKNTQYTSIANALNAPLEIALYPTLKCNMSCKFCFVKNVNKTISEELPVSSWIDIINQAKEMGVFSISILGGEPTLYPDIIPLLECANESGMNITITSNGMAVPEEVLDAIVRLNHVIPVFSLQSIGELNRYLMGGDYRKTIKTIDFLLAKKKEVRINSVYTNQSTEDFYRIIDYCVLHKIDRYSIGLYMDINKSNNGINVHTFKDARILDEKLKKYISAKYGKNKFIVSLEGCMLYTGYPDFEHDIWKISPYEKIYYGCRAGRTKLEIYANGDVYPCICFENAIQPISNITNSKLDDIWKNDEYMKKLREESALNLECQKCGYSVICNGGCPAVKKQLYHSFDCAEKDPRCELHSEVTK